MTRCRGREYNSPLALATDGVFWPVAVPRSTAFKQRLTLMHNARVADEEADALSGTHQLFSSATPAPLVRHRRAYRLG